MRDLHEATGIFLAYTAELLQNPLKCRQDTLYVYVDPANVTERHLVRLEELGFVGLDSEKCFIYQPGSH